MRSHESVLFIGKSQTVQMYCRFSLKVYHDKYYKK